MYVFFLNKKHFSAELMPLETFNWFESSKFTPGLEQWSLYYCLNVLVSSVHLKQEEKMSVVVGRDGGVQSLELYGLVTLRIADEKWARIRVLIDNKDTRGIQLQVIQSMYLRRQSFIYLYDSLGFWVFLVFF